MSSRAVPLQFSQQARAWLIGATLLWGGSFPLVRSLQLAQQAQASWVPDRVLACADVAVRFALAALILLPFAGSALFNLTRREWSQAAGLALFAGCGLYLQTLGLVWTDASISAFLTQLYVLLVPLFVALRDRVAPGARVFIACGMVMAGAALLSPGLLRHFILGPGEIVTLIGTIFFAGQIMWVERPIYSANRPEVVTFLMFALISLLAAVAFPLLGGSFRDGRALFQAAPVDELMLLLVLLCTVISFLVMNRWQRFITATEASLIYCLEPVLATVFSAFLPGWISRWAGIHYADETLRWTLLAGGGLILGATILVATRPVRDSTR